MSRISQAQLQAPSTRAQYLGDGVYCFVDHDPSILWLVTSNGIEVTNQIALDADTLRALLTLLGRSVAHADT